MHGYDINMYIIEKLIRLYFNLKGQDNIVPIPQYTEEYELEDVLTCNHTFMPVDSTKTVFACTKCGYLVTKKRLEKEKSRHNKI